MSSMSNPFATEMDAAAARTKGQSKMKPKKPKPAVAPIVKEIRKYARRVENIRGKMTAEADRHRDAMTAINEELRLANAMLTTLQQGQKVLEAAKAMFQAKSKAGV